MKKLFFVFFIIAGFFALSAQETIKPEKMYELEENFSSHKTAVEIFASTPDVNVYINGTYQGRTNLTVYDLTPGFYKVKLEKSGFDLREEVIFVKSRYGQRFWFEMSGK